MMNWFLVIVAVVVAVITVAVAWRLLHTFLDPEESKAQTETDACCSMQTGVLLSLKLVAVAAISLAAWVSLLLPYDVANRKDPTVRESEGGGLDVALLWQITLWAVVAMTVVILPFGFFIHESWDPNSGGGEAHRDLAQERDDGQGVVLLRQCCDGSCWTLMSIFIFIGLLLILYFGVGGKSQLNYTAHYCTGYDHEIRKCVVTPGGSDCRLDLRPAVLNEYQGTCKTSDEELKIRVSFFVYTVGLLTGLGWVLFVVFAGVGLWFLPVDMYNSWFDNRLEAYNRGRVEEVRHEVLTSARALLQTLRQMEHRLKQDRKEVSQKKLTATTVRVDELDRKHRRNERYVQEGVWSWMSSPFVIWGRFILFLWAVCWSCLWLIHMIVYTTLRYHPLLNEAFIALDSAFSLLGVAFYGTFSFYLLWATINGCTHVGLMILCVRIHPMKRGETLLSSFLFNCILMLYASVACVSYCAMSFREYAANTVVDTLYGTYVNRLEGLRYIMEYFQYALFGFSGLAALYWLCCIRTRTFAEADKDE